MSDTITPTSPLTKPPIECRNVDKTTVSAKPIKKSLSCFETSYRITPDLCSFMGKKADEPNSTINDAIKYIIRYINNNNLRQNDDRMYISYDKKLWDILHMTDNGISNIDIPLKYIDIHTNILAHFII